MSKDEMKFKAGFLNLYTTTVDSGAHFDELRMLMNKLSDEEIATDIHCNKWLLQKMLDLENKWDDEAKQMHLLFHNQLMQNLNKAE